MENNKSPGNDGLTKEFHCTFWNETKNIFINSLRESKCLKAFSTSQRQAIIRLIEKPNKDKQFIFNWRPILLMLIIFNWSWSDCIRQRQVLQQKWKTHS